MNVTDREGFVSEATFFALFNASPPTQRRRVNGELNGANSPANFVAGFDVF